MIKLPAYFTGFTSRSDKSIGLKFTTQELPAEVLSEMQSLNQSFGWLLYKENEDIEEVPEEDAPMDDEKSPSEVLRNRMFVYFKEKKLKGDFNTWRRGQLEIIGRKYLDKLV